jgi:hypothetical protein
MHLQPRVCDLRGRFVEHASRSGIGIVVENWRIVFFVYFAGCRRGFCQQKKHTKTDGVSKSEAFPSE